MGIIPREKENEMITLEAYRAVLSKSEVQELLNGRSAEKEITDLFDFAG